MDTVVFQLPSLGFEAEVPDPPFPDVSGVETATSPREVRRARPEPSLGVAGRLACPPTLRGAP